MTSADYLNIVGIATTGLGSTVAMVGVYLQMNGYFAIRSRDVLWQFLKILWKTGRKGKAAARQELDVAVKLGQAKGEDRVKSLIGFYFLLVGFLLQMVGSAFLIWALFANGQSTATHAC